MKKAFMRLVVIWVCCLSINALAAVDQTAKEEITPPPAEGALKPDQIPPIVSMPEATNPNPPTTTPAPATNVGATDGSAAPSGQNIQPTVAPSAPSNATQ